MDFHSIKYLFYCLDIGHVWTVVSLTHDSFRMFLSYQSFLVLFCSQSALPTPDHYYTTDLFLKCYLNRIIHYVALWARHAAVSIMYFRIVCTVACVWVTCDSTIGGLYLIEWMCYGLFAPSLAPGLISSLWLLVLIRWL